LKRAALSHIKPTEKFVLFLGIAFFMYFIAAFLGVFVGNFLFGEELFLPDTMNDWGRQDVLRMHKILQVISQVGVFVIPSLFFVYWVSSEANTYLPLRFTAAKFWYWLPVIFIGLTFLNSLLYEINRAVDFSFISKEFQDSLVYNQALSDKKISTFIGDTWLSFVGNVVVICAVPAISEEILFRGVLQRLGIELTRNLHIGILFSAVLFAVMHWQPLNFLPIFALGIVFGYITIITGSILIPITLHFLNNFFRLVLLHLEKRYDIGEMEIVGYWSVLIVLSATFLLWKSNLVKLPALEHVNKEDDAG
jgi:uncharacterized protein